MLEKLDYLIKHFYINIRQIINNSDNTLEDVKNDAYIVLYEHYDEIMNDDNVFINELRKRCLKFNKYNKRIETKAKWEEFNNLEERMSYELDTYSKIDEDTICSIADLENIIGKDSLDFLIYYYNYGYEKTALQYNLSPDNTRKRVSLLIKRIRQHSGLSGNVS